MSLFSVQWWTARNKVSNPTICGVEDWKFTVHDGVNNGLDGTFWKLSITVTDTNLWNKKLVFYILCALQHTRVLQLLISLTADSWIAKDWKQVASTLMPEVNSRLTLLQDKEHHWADSLAIFSCSKNPKRGAFAWKRHDRQKQAVNENCELCPLQWRIK